MKTLMSAIVLSLVIIAPTYAQAVDGDWFGALDVGGGQQLRLALHLTSDGKGGSREASTASTRAPWGSP